MAGSRILAKWRETEKFTHIGYLYIFEMLIIELPLMYTRLPEHVLLLLIAEVPQRPIPQPTHRVCHGWTCVD